MSSRLLLAALIGLALAVASPAPATFPGANGKIAYTSGSLPQLHVIESDGSNPTRLTSEPVGVVTPAWSPDGSTLAYISGNDIYAVDSDGGNRTRLTVNGVVDPVLSWSPDGSQLAFTTRRETGFRVDIYLMNADGTNQHRISSPLSSNLHPDWSPDGSRIAFATTRDGGLEIYVMNADGSNETRLTNHPGGDAFPSWSPDATKLAFSTTRDGNSEIYVMNADGSNPTRLTNSAAIDQGPAWSPDGTKVAFSSSVGLPSEIDLFVMNADGGNPTRLTSNPGFDGEADWQPLRSPAPSNSCGEVRGDGRLDTNSLTRFVFHKVQSDGVSAPTGEISFSDRAAEPRLHFESTVIRTLVITGGHVTLTGSGSANGQPVEFTVEGDDGSPDRFSIRLSNGYSAAGAVASGRGVNVRSC